MNALNLCELQLLGMTGLFHIIPVIVSPQESGQPVIQSVSQGEAGISEEQYVSRTT